MGLCLSVLITGLPYASIHTQAGLLLVRSVSPFVDMPYKAEERLQSCRNPFTSRTLILAVPRSPRRLQITQRSLVEFPSHLEF